MRYRIERLGALILILKINYQKQKRSDDQTWTSIIFVTRCLFLCMPPQTIPSYFLGHDALHQRQEAPAQKRLKGWCSDMCLALISAIVFLIFVCVSSEDKAHKDCETSFNEQQKAIENITLKMRTLEGRLYGVEGGCYTPHLEYGFIATETNHTWCQVSL